MPPSRLWSLSYAKCECPKPQNTCESREGVSQLPQGTCGSPSHRLTHASRSYQPVLCLTHECPPRDPSLCWPSRNEALPPPCKVPGPWHPNVPSLSPVPSSLQPTGKCLLYCNGVLEPLYLCPNGARCATWFQDPTRFTGTMVRSSCAPNWVCRHSPGIQIAQAANPGKNR